MAQYVTTEQYTVLKHPADILFSVSFAPAFIFSVWQDVSQEDIPIMLVGNKCDLRQSGVNSVPTSYGEKLAMVMTKHKHALILLYLWGHFNNYILSIL